MVSASPSVSCKHDSPGPLLPELSHPHDAPGAAHGQRGRRQEEPDESQVTAKSLNLTFSCRTYTGDRGTSDITCLIPSAQDHGICRPDGNVHRPPAEAEGGEQQRAAPRQHRHPGEDDRALGSRQQRTERFVHRELVKECSVLNTRTGSVLLNVSFQLANIEFLLCSQLVLIILNLL